MRAKYATALALTNLRRTLITLIESESGLRPEGQGEGGGAWDVRYISEGILVGT